MKILALLALSLVCVAVNSYTPNKRETKALHRSPKNTRSKKISLNNIFENLCISYHLYM